MHRAPILLILLTSVAAPRPADAQSDAQLWTSAGASGTISGPVQGSVDSIARFGDTAAGPYQVNASAALGYRLSKHVTIWAGYVSSLNSSRGKPTLLEQRAREDLTATLGKLAGGTVAVRARAEERWREDGRDTGWRGRFRVQWTRPFRRGGKSALILSHESFVNFDSTDWGQRAGYERMRNAIGIATPLLRNVTGTAGYLNQHGFVRGGRDTSDNVATFGIALSF